MSDTGLAILRGCLIALLYLFLIRVVLLVARELRGTPAPIPEPQRFDARVDAMAEARVAAAGAAEPPTIAEPLRRKTKGWQLVVVDPKTRRGERFDVDGEATIGRGGGCAISLTDDTFISTVHARVFQRDGALWVEDLGSTNGTVVDGQPLTEPRELRRGSKLQVGSTVLEARR